MYEGISDRKRSKFWFWSNWRFKMCYLDQRYPTIVDEQFYPLGTLSLRENQYQLWLGMYCQMNRTWIYTKSNLVIEVDKKNNLVIREVLPTDCSPRKTSLNFLSGLPKSEVIMLNYEIWNIFIISYSVRSYLHDSTKQL